MVRLQADEMLMHTYFNIYGMSVTALRFFTVYGPMGELLPMLSNMLKVPDGFARSVGRAP